MSLSISQRVFGRIASRYLESHMARHTQLRRRLSVSQWQVGQSRARRIWRTRSSRWRSISGVSMMELALQLLAEARRETGAGG